MDEWQQAEGQRSVPPARLAVLTAMLVVLGLGLALAGGAGDDGTAGGDLRVERAAAPEGDDPASRPQRESVPFDHPPVAPDENDPGFPPEDKGADRLGEWTPMADSPLAPRTGHHAIWTGERVLFWGGAGTNPATGGQAHHADGAFYDPAEDTWTELPDAPMHQPGMSGGVWTGRELIVFGQSGQAAFEPATEEWRMVPDPPDGRWRPHTAAWAGGQMVVLGTQQGEDVTTEHAAIAYDPDADAWRQLPAPPFGTPRPHTAGLGDLLVVFGRQGPDHMIAAFDPANDSWTAAEPLPGDENVIGALRDIQAGPEGTRVLLAGAHYDGSWTPLVASWAPPPEGGWSGPEDPPPEADAVRRLTLTRDGTIMWIHGAAAGGLKHTSDGWQALGHSPLGRRSGSGVVWTGEELVVWGGATATGATADGARWRPDVSETSSAR